jgi:hypothetical protein
MKSKKRKAAAALASPGISASSCKQSQGVDGDNGEEDNLPSPDDHHPQAEDKCCPHCFLFPCIATSSQNAIWMGPGQAPSPLNAAIRKDKYRRLWKCIANLGGWNLNQYILKKQNFGGHNRGDIVYHKHKIMPQCVLYMCEAKVS